MKEDWIKQNVKCCACGGTLDTSEVLNICVTNKIATWKFPICGSLDCPDFPPKAVAFGCDECIKNKVKIRRCIEYEVSTGQITYHDIDDLEDDKKSVSQMDYYFGKKSRRKMLLLKTARQECEN